jgi:hypothetical protein
MPHNQCASPGALVFTLAWAQEYPVGFVFMVRFGVP